MRLEGKVAIVTGAAAGIGRGIAERFVAEGARVLISDLDANATEETARQISGDSEQCSSCACDVGDAEAIDRMVTLTVERYGGIDIAVCNAGMAIGAPFLELEVADFDRVMRVNVRGVFLTARAAARRFVESGTRGNIITIGSIAGVLSAPDHIPNCTSKAAAHHMSATMAVALAPHGIRVNTLAPGSINTELMQRIVRTSPEAWQMVMSRTPMGRAGEVDEVATAAVFLASDDSSYVTGSVLLVDGGYIPLMYTMSPEGPLAT